MDYYLHQVGAPLGAPPVINVPRDEGRYLAIHPFSGSATKNWPLVNFQEVARLCPMPIQFCAGPEEVLAGAERFQSLWEVSEWLASARAYLGNDSGIGHLAAAIGVPAIVIFRHTDPAIWAPRGPSVTVLQEPTVSEVLDSLRCLA
ncbi:MAG: glycosyltransferase family 9 protein [Bryobacteraceae bacterium]